MNDEKIPYLKNDYKNFLQKEWQLFDAQKGAICIPELCLSMDKSPPPLKGAPTPPPAPKTQAVAPTQKPPEKSSAEIFRDWLLKEKSTKEEDKKKKLPPPFDLYNMPQALKAAGFPIGEKLSNRWFNGRAYLGPRVKNPHTGKLEDGIYAEDMVDSDTVKLNWLFEYAKVKKEYDVLLSTLSTKNALKVIKQGEHGDGGFVRFFNTNPSFSGELDTLTYCKGNRQTLHQLFQFQFRNVSQWIEVDINNYKTYAMTDLIASLANFGFYAAIAKARIQSDRYNRYNTPKGTLACTHRRIEVTHIYTYAKDTYTFYDNNKSSQYLGHWNKTGVVLEPHALTAELATRYSEGTPVQVDFEAGNYTTPPFPIDIGYKLLERDVYYPVRNRTYMEWREKHKRGGDFIVFSDLKLIKLDKPILIDMGEICR